MSDSKPPPVTIPTPSDAPPLSTAALTPATNPAFAAFSRPDSPSSTAAQAPPSIIDASLPPSTTAPLAAEATSTPLAALPSISSSSSTTGPTPNTDPSHPPSSDADSTLGTEYDPSNYTASLTSSITAYESAHNRTYHAYQAGRYLLPNDEQEQERMDLQYHAFRLAFGDNLFFSPVGDTPTHILDIGTGTGIWAIDCAERYPDTEVTGTDLSPIQPKWVPPNVRFEVDDAEQEWTFPERHFDLVHGRILNGSLRDWDKYFMQAYKHLKPGGWVEAQELSVDAKSDDGSLAPDSYITQWCENQEKAFKTIGSSLQVTGEKLAEKMRAVGFENVVVREFKLPIGTWPADPNLRETGAFQLVAMLDGILGLTIMAWCKFLGWREEEVEVFVARVRGEWRTRGIHSYWPLYAVYGQKPNIA